MYVHGHYKHLMVFSPFLWYSMKRGLIGSGGMKRGLIGSGGRGPSHWSMCEFLLRSLSEELKRELIGRGGGGTIPMIDECFFIYIIEWRIDEGVDLGEGRGGGGTIPMIDECFFHLHHWVENWRGGWFGIRKGWGLPSHWSMNLLFILITERRFFLLHFKLRRMCWAQCKLVIFFHWLRNIEKVSENVQGKQPIAPFITASMKWRNSCCALLWFNSCIWCQCAWSCIDDDMWINSLKQQEITIYGVRKKRSLHFSCYSDGSSACRIVSGSSFVCQQDRINVCACVCVWPSMHLIMNWGWVVQLCCSWLSLRKATQISQGRNCHWDNKVYKIQKNIKGCTSVAFVDSSLGIRLLCLWDRY